MRKRNRILLLFLGAFALLQLTHCTRKLPNDVIDTHVHVENQESSASLDTLVSQMDKYGFSHQLIMEAPSPVLPTGGSSMATKVAFFSSQAFRFRFLYGGMDLNPILHALGRPNASTLTIADLYPNGGGSQANVDSVKAVAADPATYTTQFQTDATNAANSGLYVGFGEIAAYHASRRSGHPQIIWALNHTLMKWLSDLAASKNMVIDVHVEAVDEKMAEFSELLAHNRNTKIIWQHAGWGETGGATAEVVSAMMAQNPNLYLGLKVRPPEDHEMESCSMFDERGKLKSEWVELIKAYADRIMIGTDPKFFESGKGATSAMMTSGSGTAELLLQLPSSTASEVAHGTAKRLFGI